VTNREIYVPPKPIQKKKIKFLPLLPPVRHCNPTKIQLKTKTIPLNKKSLLPRNYAPQPKPIKNKGCERKICFCFEK
jgi:hypothetical protein